MLLKADNGVGHSYLYFINIKSFMSGIFYSQRYVQLLISDRAFVRIAAVNLTIFNCTY